MTISIINRPNYPGLTSVDRVRNFIARVNQMHLDFSKYYFYQEGFQSLKLNRTIPLIPKKYIYHYRLNLHESINDYLMSDHYLSADIEIPCVYRVKTRESIDDKIERLC